MALACSDDRAELVLSEVLKLQRMLQPDVLVQAAIAAVTFAAVLNRTPVPPADTQRFSPTSLFYLASTNFNLPFFLLF